MVLSRKNSVNKKSDLDAGLLSLTLELQELIQKEFGAVNARDYALLSKLLVSPQPVKRVVLFQSFEDSAEQTMKFVCLDDSSGEGLKRKLDQHVVFKKSQKAQSLLTASGQVQVRDLVSHLNNKQTDSEWLTFFESENSCLFPVVRNESCNGFLYVELEPNISGRNKINDLVVFYTLASQLLFDALERTIDKSPSAFKDWLFESFSYPVFVVDTESKRILKANNVLESVLGRADADNCFSPASLISFVESVVDKVNYANPLVWTRGYLPNLYGDFYVIATLFGASSESEVYAFIVPANDKQWDFVNLLKKFSKGKLLAEAATKQLYWDRLIRQVVTRLHSTLDANMIPQLMVDNVGQCLSASRCLFIKSDSDSMVVTHEYTNPSISPLGFGRTARFPESVVNLFRNGPLAIADVTSLRLGNTLASSDVSSLLNNGITSLAGAPVICGGVLYGVLIVIELGENREWTSNEMEMIRVASSNGAIAIELSLEHQKIKDQLYQASTIRGTDIRPAGTSVPTQKAGKVPTATPESADVPHLSERELEVLRLIASGLSNKEIAGRLFLTASTVELHASRMRKKLKMKSRTQLVKYACDHGLV